MRGIRLVLWIGRIRHLVGTWVLEAFFVQIVLDIHLPSGVVFLEALNEVLGEGLVASHGHEGVTEHIESAAGVVAFDDSE